MQHGSETEIVTDREPGHSNWPVSSPLRILLAEDNADNLLVATTLLHKLGHETVPAGAASRIASHHNYNDEALYNAVCEDFLTTGPNLLQRLQQAAATSDMEQAALLAHSFKSISGTVGATNCFSLAEQVEHAARRSDKSATLAGLEKLSRAASILWKAIQ